MNKRTLVAALSVALLGGVGAFSTAAVAGSVQPKADTDAGPLDILLTNDDGWRGPGGSSTPLIVAVRDALVAAGHHVVVSAPGTDQSGQGGRFSLPPLTLEVANPEADVWTVTPGSPADSVFFGLDEGFSDSKPDLVISGINPGNNAGQAVNHSGTVNAALTALEFGVPSVAFSLETPPTWREGTAAATPSAAAYVAGFVERLQANAKRGELMPEGVNLNVNIPVRPGPIDPATGKPGSVLPPKGERLTTVASSQFLSVNYQNTTGRSGEPGTYTIGLGAPAGAGAAQGTDVDAVADGYISVTPLESDRDTDGATYGWLRKFL